jgi:hypothetical protein
MAISNGQYTVGDTPLALNITDEDGMLVVLNTDKNVYLGDEEVTTDTGFLLRSTDGLLFLDLAPNEILYAICKDEKAIVTTLRTKNK